MTTKITYELAKELKKAGFPQKEHILDDKTMSTCVRCSFMESYTQTHPHGGDYDMCVTLSELIEACGEGFTLLERYSNGEYGCMETLQVYDGGSPLDEMTHGKTPEEAVARLWLCLNKKENA